MPVAVVLVYFANRKFIEFQFTKKYVCKDPQNINTDFMSIPTLLEALGHLKDGTVLEYFHERIRDAGWEHTN